MVRRIVTAIVIVVMLVVVFSVGIATGVHRELVNHQLRLVIKSVLGVFSVERKRRYADPDALRPGVAVIGSGLLNFDLTIVSPRATSGDVGGGLGLTESGLLIAHDRDGFVDYYDEASDSMRTLRFRLPSLNREGLPAWSPRGQPLSDAFMRYQDIEVYSRLDGPRVAIHHVYYDDRRSCFVTRLESARLPDDWQEPLTDGKAPVLLDWDVLVETAPCLPITEDRLGGNQTGGRIFVESSSTLLLTTGDFEYDGIGDKQLHASQSEGSLWGRVLRINLDTGAVTEVSRGHRNPQGLTRDASGNLWSVEHGPQGGDELNLIREGANYGWPEVTLGVDYVGTRESDAKYWPHSDVPGRHDGFDGPVFAWMPSIAPSSIKLIIGLSDRWDGDLLVSTLIDESLHRLRLKEGRVLYDERIFIDRRIRDVEIDDGRIYILFDDGAFGYLVPHSMVEADDAPPPIATPFVQSGCVTCHTRPRAPDLAQVFGSDIASQQDVDYSDALKAVAGAWDRERLRAFLTEPEAYAPGTAMPSPGLGAETMDTVLDEFERSSVAQ